MDHSFLSYVPDKQTNKQTDLNILPTPTNTANSPLAYAYYVLIQTLFHVNPNLRTDRQTDSIAYIADLAVKSHWLRQQ